MPRLDASLVENRLPIKLEFCPFQQPLKMMLKEEELKIEEEIKMLLNAKFIMLIRYVQWLEIVVLIMKKNGKLQVCVDLRDFNMATPKKMYVIPIIHISVDSTTNNKLLSFMDDFSRYNQILIAKEDVPKTSLF